MIAFDGKSIAADMQGTFGGFKRKISKLSQETVNGKNYVVGQTGVLTSGLMLLEWFRNGSKSSDFPETQKDKDDWSRLIVGEVGSGKIWFYERQSIPIPVLDKFTAWGSGEDFAIGALAMGADAYRAVEIACEFSTGCGMGIEVYSLL